MSFAHMVYRYGGEVIEEYQKDEATNVISSDPSTSGKVIHHVMYTV